MNKTLILLLVLLALVPPAALLFASPPYVEVQPGAQKSSTTQGGWTWMPGPLGGPDASYALFRLGPLSAGRSYALTLSYDAGTDIGYAHSWIDGDPAGKDWASLVGIGSGTGTREMKGKEEKFLFTVDPRSTAGLLYLLVRTGRPWDLSVALADRPAGLTREAKDRWGYYYVTDFDLDRHSPFLLTRSSAPAPAPAPQAAGYLELAPNTSRPVMTARSFPAMPNFFGGPEAFYAILHLKPLEAGRRYELTLTFDAGTNIGYATGWVDGDPLGGEYWSFVGTGTGTGTREMKGKQQKFRFSVDPRSTSSSMYLLLRSSQPWGLSVGLADQLTPGLTPSSQDPWGYTYLDDFDESRHAPFLLTRSHP